MLKFDELMSFEQEMVIEYKKILDFDPINSLYNRIGRGRYDNETRDFYADSAGVRLPNNGRIIKLSYKEEFVIKLKKQKSRDIKLKHILDEK